MQRIYRHLLLLLPMLLLSVTALAAQTEPDECDPVTVNAQLGEALTQLEAVRLGFEDLPAFETKLQLRAVETQLADLIEACAAGLPTPTRRASTRARTYYVVSPRNVNARSCPRTSCEVVALLVPAQAVSVLDSATGDTVSGSDDWWLITVDGDDAYVHSSLVSTTRPTQQTTGSGSSGGSVPPTQPISTPPPVQSQPTSPPAPGFTCNCSKTCGQMASCDEAYFQLNQCGCGQRDGDGDGVPCEDICSGG